MKRVLFLLLPLLLAAGCTITGNVVKEHEPLRYELYFCPESDCYMTFAGLLNSSASADCALYTVDGNILDNAVRHNDSIRVFTDNATKLRSPFMRASIKSGLMHHKFCILNKTTVITGSFNPTKGSLKDDNNLIILHSGQLAKNYQDEFDELWNRKKDEKTMLSKIELGNANIENYFCPEDDCAQKVEDALDNANKSIYFMDFSFTHRGIANSLILAKNWGL